ncbi:MAG: hypothetical protein KDD35_07675, partial [Bdellovibrionales bacterium]|nr:hypothetical protein [Bdellovibrionales bacterium]
ILALSDRWHLSTILVSMTTGISSRFITNNSNDSLESIEEGIYMILFILAGCHFQLSVFTTSIPLMIVYIISRSAGKYVGTYVGTSYAGATGKVRKYVGIGLIPQAGVAIGLTLLLAEMAPFENIKMTVLNLIIGATIIHEVLGPLLTKYALGKAGEISN